MDFKAQFKSNTEVNLLDQHGDIVDSITAPHIIINTGATSIIPNIKGLDQAKHVFDSTGLLNISYQPEAPRYCRWRLYRLRICFNVCEFR
ncbi:hypothetical protein UM764_04365 [Staphylococcus aureus]|nr:hypothetical protein UM764_04365 [Staphylococcus aureus]